ncbi:hypothetical protein GALMADRAFT_216743 [Galerina marginata CBS 339.88]|uniref:beta-ketoacyl-[acyl-carrier-protein] synthase I n=1 Tax=Galerina marginata (strain CBS 339.88) TaxID=685588 RepID=A0A067S7Q3_GALM3|nr:hypothetical protein GALMADRAFT_216743 [Galerina marginata CBS 339.88]
MLRELPVTKKRLMTKLETPTKRIMARERRAPSPCNAAWTGSAVRWNLISFTQICSTLNMSACIYANLGLDLDYILPFAGIPENGREVDGLDDRSELAHPMMLVNLLRILGAVKNKKASRRFVTRPTQVILPLSPNHGLFGNDGLYSESKISLETLFQRWASESWGEYLCLAGADIGQNGGMDRLPDLADITSRIRTKLNQKADLRRAITRDNSADYKIINGHEAERLLQTVDVQPRANFRFEFPSLETSHSLQDLSHLRGLVDLDKVLVITGFGEVGPWGSSRTRWEMEACGEFTIEGCIEMAWIILGFIMHFDGCLKDGSLYVGWVDSKTDEPVDDKDVRGRYEQEILLHASVRLIEPELFRGYNPNKKIFNQEVELIHDLEPIEVRILKHKNSNYNMATNATSGQEKVDNGLPNSRKEHIPTGWHAGRYGIPDDIIAKVDRSTLWALVSTVEALNASGITDPYELYKHMHPSDIRTALGSGMGGTISMGKMFKDRRDEKEVQNDILQETFINTTAGWINLLLLSSSGLVKIPVGACATSLQSLEIASDTILSGKAKVMIAGGFDGLSEEVSFEFANMKATSNAETEFAMGREPTEMPLPATKSRAGLMESQGVGIHIVMIRRQHWNWGRRSEHMQLQELQCRKSAGEAVEQEYVSTPKKDALALYGMLEGSDAHVAPLRRALAVWGLTADDIGVLSIRGTSTGAKEENETRIWNDVFATISRSPGNAVPIIAQKSLIGRAKGGSAAWQAAGLLQSVITGIIPGNRNSE